MLRSAAYLFVAWWTAHLSLMFVSLIEIVVYAFFVAPGLDQAAYQAHAQASGPWISTVLGLPLFWGLTRWLLSRLEDRRAGAIVWALYTVTDFGVVAMMGGWTVMLFAQWILAQGLKALGVWLALRGAR